MKKTELADPARSGRATAWGWAGLVFVAGGLLWLRSVGRTAPGSVARIPLASVDEPGTPPADDPGTPTRAAEEFASPERVATRAEPEIARLALRIVHDGRAPATGPTLVVLRKHAGEPVAELELVGERQWGELECPPGDYEVLAEHPGPPPLSTGPLEIRLGPGAREELELRLLPVRSLRGSVVDTNGSEVSDLPLALELGGKPRARANSGPTGHFSFSPLPEGDYVLIVGDPRGPIVPRVLVRLEAESSERTVVVPPLLELEVQVVDEHGLGVGAAAVEGKGESGGRLSGETDATGRLRAGRLPAGKYRVFASQPDIGRGNAIFELTSESRAPLVIRLLTGRPPR